MDHGSWIMGGPPPLPSHTPLQPLALLLPHLAHPCTAFGITPATPRSGHGARFPGGASPGNGDATSARAHEQKLLAAGQEGGGPYEDFVIPLAAR